LPTQSRLALIEQADQTDQVSGSVAGDSSSRVPHGGNAELASNAGNPEAEGGGLSSIEYLPKGIIQAGQIAIALVVVSPSEGVRDNTAGLLGSSVTLAKQREAQRCIFKQFGTPGLVGWEIGGWSEAVSPQRWNRLPAKASGTAGAAQSEGTE
jgi:hypothetical protein